MRALGTLTQAGVRVLVFKGAALAHTHYPAAHVRVRSDTDVLVPAVDVHVLANVLNSLGYERPPQTSGSLVSYQTHYQKTDRYGVTHAFDVHWKVSNLQALADCLTFEELWEARVPVPALGPSAVTPCGVHALLLALVHRAGHHPGSGDLLWIYDLHLLAGRLTPEEILQVQELAGGRGLSQIAADGLALAHEWFGTATVDRAVDALRAGASSRVAGIHAMRSRTDVLLVDLRALSGWRARGRLIREHLIPPASYMRARYGVRSTLLLPGLYVWRMMAGAPKWLVNHHAEDDATVSRQDHREPRHRRREAKRDLDDR